MSFQDYAQSMKSKMRLGNINPKLAIGIVLIVVVIACVAIYTMFSLTNNTESSDKANASEGVSIEESASNEEEDTKDICVYISGCVVSPGICYLPEGSRVADAINACGGMSEGAATDAINLARPLEDGEQITVLSEQEVQASAAQAQASPSQSTAQNGAEATASISTNKSSGKVNINTATLADLQTLSGIGESKASKIIAYREDNGPFKSVDELTNVSGIGEKTLESIKDMICV